MASTLSVLPTTTLAQASASPPKAGGDSRSSFEFEVATIKPMPPEGGHFGFVCYPNGKVDIGAEPLTMLLAFAFDVQPYQIKGGPDWAGTDRYDLVAQPNIPPEGTAKHPGEWGTPTREQRIARKKLLIERFALKFHTEKRLGPVYILTRGSGPLTMQTAKDRTKEPLAAIVGMDDRFDGRALGINATTAVLADSISSQLERPVIDQTGLTDSYDFRLPPFDMNNTDVSVAIFKDMERLGLKLKPGKGLVETIVIDSAQRPTPN